MTGMETSRPATEREARVYGAANALQGRFPRKEVSSAVQAAADAPVVVLGPCVLTLAELIERDFPARDPMLGNWLLCQSLNMIYAWRGVGKTHFALGVAFAIASGTGFLEWKAPRARRVLYLDGEMPGAAIRDRLKALVLADDTDFDTSNLLIVTPDAQEGPMPDLATAEGQEVVTRLAIDRNVDLVVVDNVSTLCRNAGPENDAESWRAPQEWALRMRRLGKSVLFIHHSGKGGQQRGSSKREDTLDTVIKLQRPSDYQPEENARFEIHFEKYRAQGGEDARPLEAHLVTDARGNPVWSCRTLDDSTYDRVVALANEGFKPGEIAQEVGINKSTVSRHLKRGRDEGTVTVATTGTRRTL